MKAKDRKHYLEAWRSHLNQFIHVAIDSDTPCCEWEELKKQIDDMIVEAANNVFDSPSRFDDEQRCSVRSSISGQRCIKERGHLIAHQWEVRA